jgi:hypothetical protein
MEGWETYTQCCFNCYLRFYGVMQTVNGWCVSELLVQITQVCPSRAAVNIDDNRRGGEVQWGSIMGGRKRGWPR